MPQCRSAGIEGTPQFGGMAAHAPVWWYGGAGGATQPCEATTAKRRGPKRVKLQVGTLSEAVRWCQAGRYSAEQIWDENESARDILTYG